MNKGDKVYWDDFKKTRGIVIDKNRRYVIIKWENGRVLSYSVSEKGVMFTDNIKLDIEEIRNDKIDDILGL